MTASPAAHHPKASSIALTLGALGVVFGDIGTSPLYTLRECLREVSTHSGHPATGDDVLGLLSLIFWSLTLVVTVKYLSFVMRADNHGEGGIFALLAVVPESLRARNGSKVSTVALLVVIGAALLYGDGAITPAVSVLSALEGVKVLRPEWSGAVVPATCVILLALFAVQKRGTGAVGTFFGPVMALWFITIAGLGAFHISQNIAVLKALSPHFAVRFFIEHGMPGFLVLGSVVLAVTGGEALYADMGHFGLLPIRRAWLVVVMPALLLCYFGQGALVLAHPEAVSNPFFSMVPTGPATVALIILSSVATVVASQALISGAFSLTRQAQQLGYFPRVTIQHTARETEGQIYIPEINWILAATCLLLVVSFQKSERLASAYGIAVTGTMLLTSLVFAVVMRRTWKWPLWACGAVLGLFLAIDIPFFLSNAAKLVDGGWVPVAIGVCFITAMLIWSRGRSLIVDRFAAQLGTIEAFIERVIFENVTRVPGAAVFMASSATHAPPVLAHMVERVRSLHQRVFLLTVLVEPRPVVPLDERCEVIHLEGGFTRVVARFGYMEEPNVPAVMAMAALRIENPPDLSQITYFLGREAVLGLGSGSMGAIAESIFALLQRNAVTADRAFKIPPKQAVELGIQIDL